MQKFSYHTHTNFSDGRNSIAEMINHAERLDWQEIGISDHLIVHKNVRQSLSWPRWEKCTNTPVYYFDFKKATDDFCRHKEAVHKEAKGRNIKVRVGAEVDYFVYDGWIEEFDEFRRKTELDYYISGNHYLQPNNGNDILDMIETTLLPPKEIEKLLKQHFNCICQAIESKKFLFIAHIDYARNRACCGDNDYIEEKRNIVKCLQKNKIFTEINTKGLRKNKNFYPTNWLLKEIISSDIPLIISDDAHCTEELGKNFLEAEQLLKNINCKNRYNL